MNSNRDEHLIHTLRGHYNVEFFNLEDSEVEARVEITSNIETNNIETNNIENNNDATLDNFTNVIMSLLTQGGINVIGTPRVQLVRPSNETYESLLRLAELIPPVSRGAPQEVINGLVTYVFEDERSEDKCNICLSEYVRGETVLKLPKCSHIFHRDCITRWLSINRICPICREEII